MYSIRFCIQLFKNRSELCKIIYLRHVNVLQAKQLVHDGREALQALTGDEVLVNDALEGDAGLSVHLLLHQKCSREPILPVEGSVGLDLLFVCGKKSVNLGVLVGSLDVFDWIWLFGIDCEQALRSTVVCLVDGGQTNHHAVLL